MHAITAPVVIAMFVAYCLWVVIALAGVLTSRLGLLTKVVWIAVIFALPFLGSLLWHLMGKKAALAQ